MSFDALGLAPELLHAVADEGYTVPTPVQREAIPLVLAGRDLLAGAQTGTGKTAAFVLPIIQMLHATRVAPAQLPPAPPRFDGSHQRPAQASRRTPASARPPVRVLVVVPTRELAIQVEESVRTYGAHRPIRSTTVYGGVGFEPQASRLRAGPEIVVATPGRLLDHVTQRTIDLSRVEILVLDEADRLLDMGFIRDIRRIIALLPERRQNLLFSATFSDDVRSLSNLILHDPARVQVTPRNTTAELVEQVVLPVDRERKRELLSHLVTSGRITQALVFTRTKHGANRLAEQLVKGGINAAAIHGNKSQSQRVRALGDFKAGRVGILVATDIAARGLDIEQLPHVVNYELPMVPEDYIHRIGRTGRAGTDGQAVSLVCVDERPLLRDIQALLRHTIPSEVIAGFEPDRNVRAEAIRLRSTPAERAAHAAARIAPSGRRGTSSQGTAPARGGSPLHAGSASRAGSSSRDSRRRRPHRGGASVPGATIGNVMPGSAHGRTPDGRRHDGHAGSHRHGLPVDHERSQTFARGRAEGATGPRVLPGERIRRLDARG